MPYIGNVLTSFAVETGNINDQAVTAPKLSATGGTNGQVLALDSDLNLEWVSDPAGQWVTSGSNIYYNDGNVGIGTTSPDALLDVENSSGASEIQIKSLNASDCTLAFGDNADTDVGRIRYTHSADAMLFFTAATERMRIDSSGRVGLGTSSPTDTNGYGTTLDIRGSGVGNGGVIYLRNSDATVTGQLAVYGDGRMDIGTATNHPLRFFTFNSERLRIDNSGRLLVGATTSRTVCGQTPQLQLEGLNVNQSTLGLSQNANDANSPLIVFGKSRATTLGGSTIVADDDRLGGIRFSGGDGTDLTSIAASIESFVDGTPGSNDMPGRLVFSTTADGASSVTERMRINSSGNVGINNSSPTEKLSVGGAIIATSNANNFAGATGGLIDYHANNMRIVATATSGVSNGMTFFIANSGSMSEAMRIDTSGRLLVGNTSEIQSGSNLEITDTDAGAVLTLGRNDSSISAGNGMGAIDFYGNAGGTYQQLGRILSVAEGTHALNSKKTGIAFYTNNGSGSASERARFDGLGRLLVGTSSNIGSTAVDAYYAKLQVVGRADGGANDGRIAIVRNENSASITDQERIGRIVFADQQEGTYALIDCRADGNAGSNDYPGNLIFSTTADAASSATERMRIDSEGKTTIKGNGTSNNPFEILTLENTETSSSAQSIQINLETNRNSQQGISKIKSVANDNSGTALLQFNSSQYRFKNQADNSTYATLDSDGLKFNADTAAANALYDYEEGSWTPTLAWGGTAATLHNDTAGSYTKIGNLVLISFQIRQTSRNTPSGSALIGGLPFNESSATTYGHGMIQGDNGINMPSGAGSIMMYLNSSTSRLLYQTNTGHADLLSSHCADATFFYGFAVYNTAS